MFKKLTHFASEKGYEILKNRGAHCPECGRPIDLPASLPEDGFHSTIKCGSCPWMGSIGGLNRAPEDDAASSGGGSTVRVKPADSKIKDVVGIQKATWLIPAKKGFNFLMFFAAFWLSIVSVITFGMITGNVDSDGGDLPAWAGGLFLIPFWLIGIGVAYTGLRMAYTELLIRVDQDAVILTRKFFNRMWDKSIPRENLGDVSLGVAYSQNNSPVYQIEIDAREGKGIKFGSNLSEGEKQWLLGGLRRFLADENTSQYAGAVSSVGGSSGASVLATHEVESKTIKVERVGQDAFRVTRVYRAGPWLLAVGLALTVGMVVGLAVVWGDFDGGGASGLAVLFDLLFSAVPFLMLLIGFCVGVGLVVGGYWATGRKNVFEFGRDRLVLTYHWRGRRKQKKIPRADIRKVVMKNSGQVNGSPRYKLTLITDRKTLSVCDYEKEETASAVKVWIQNWLA